MPRLPTQLVEQIQLEEETWSTGLDKYDGKLLKLIESGAIQDSKEVILIIKATVDTLSSYIQKYLKLQLRGNNKKCQLFLKETFGTADNISYALIKSTLGILLKNRGGDKTKVLNVSRELVKSLQNYNNIQQFKEERPKLFSYIEQKNKRKGDSEVRKQKIRTSRKLVKSLSLSDTLFKLLGTVCIDLIYKSGCNLITLTQHKSSYIVDLSDEVKALFLRSKIFFGNMTSTFYPLIYPPKKWENIVGSGGYYTQKDINFIKTRSRKDLSFILETKPDLERLMNIVNSIQEVPYRINTRILNVINTIIKYNLVNPMSSPTNPILYGEIPYMEKMNIHSLIPKTEYGEIDSTGKFLKVEDKKRWLKAMDEQDTKIRRIESKRLAYKMALQVAEKFKEYPEIYFSYNLCFRGRLYPLQTFLHPQLSSNIKPLLQFKNGQVLNADGVYWLKIQGANCLGYGKETEEDRIKIIEEKEEEIKAINQDPIANIKYWYGAEEPLNYLAFCFDYGEYLKNPQHEVHTPVHLDCTCSGIQMYSGLLLDREGAIAVNVINGKENKVNDIYKDVANLVNQYLVTGDYEKSIDFTTKDKVTHSQSTVLEANSIKGKIDRGLTKRNVMTQPYSVTRRGMYEQVYDILSDKEDNNEVFWQGEKFIVAHLISSLNNKAIGEIVKGAKLGQLYIKETLKKALATTDYAFWYSPIFGFPILQRIKKEKRQQLRTPLGQLVLYYQTEETHYLKMLNGIAPNFIHSLDATLLYRTVERCLERGVSSFWLVHDDYGVLPNDVPILNQEFREAYIELFKRKPLLEFVEQILPDEVENIKSIMINTLDLDEVRDSRYIIS